MAETHTLTVILPTRDEAEGILSCLDRVETALLASDIDSEIIVVDDSNDSTPDLVRSRDAALPLRVLHREPRQRHGGLIGAVSLAFQQASGEYLCVMDADLQHPPEQIAGMFERAGSGFDVVIASRYCRGGSAYGLGGARRRLASLAAASLTRALFFRRIGGIADPLSGFFLLNRRVIDTWTPPESRGFKILLDVLLRGSWQSHTEMAYRFEPRRSGASKASAAQGWAFIKQATGLMTERGQRLPLAHSHPFRVRETEAETEQQP